MQTLSRILAATDFSACAGHAARRAALLARAHGAALGLVHVLEPDALTFVRDWLDEERDIWTAMAEQAAIELAAAAQQLGAEAGLEVEPDLRNGSALEELCGLKDADLLVLGARGASAARSAVLGSTADRLLRSAQLPMLVVREAPAGDYRKVLVLMDFSPASVAAFEFAQRLAPAAGFHLLHAFDIPYEGRMRLAGVRDGEMGRYRDRVHDEAQVKFDALLAGRPPQQFLTSIEQGDVRVRYQHAREALRPDLVVVAKQSRSFASDMFLGSVTRSVLYEATSDVLVATKGTLPA